jgi:glutamate/tyrosine decarboxylase-like PLP-dependent enzyme
MNITSLTERVLANLPRRMAEMLYGSARRIRAVRRLIDDEYDEMLDSAPIDRPAGEHRVFRRLPTEGVSRPEILADVAALAAAEEADWRAGHASGAVYHGDADHVDFLNEVYALHSQSNPLHIDLWPSGTKFEAEIVSMTAAMLGAQATGDDIVGNVTSGGTESIIMAMKAYRDRAGFRRPEMVLPTTAHVAFDKAAHYFGYRQIRLPVGDDCRADVGAMAQAMTRRTVVVVGSAPGFPHGVIDPIEQLSEIARERGVGFHTDACLGGFVLPWAERLGHEVTPFDFRLPGVTSMSADTHKYGYSAKGTSVVLYRGRELRQQQYFVATDWPGGLYYSPAMAGSATASILAAAAKIRAGIANMPELRVLGDPLWVIAFASEEVNIYEVMARMGQRGWSLNGLHHPAAVHIAVTLRHTRPGVAENFIGDLREAVDEARATGGEPQTGAAPMYGMAATFPARSAVGELLRRFIDRLYTVEDSDGS